MIPHRPPAVPEPPKAFPRSLHSLFRLLSPSSKLLRIPAGVKAMPRCTLKSCSRPLLVKTSRMLCWRKHLHSLAKTTESGERVQAEKVSRKPLSCSPLTFSLGKRVRLSGQRLREKLLPESAQTSITRVAVNGNLAGHAFVCRWACAGKQICWITQLVIGKHYREQGLATCLLTSLRKDEDDVFGIMSSHPAACLTAAKAFGSTYAHTTEILRC